MWYKENEFCENDFCAYNQVKGHAIVKCMKLKGNVHDLIDQKEIIVGINAQASPNGGLQIYQNTFPPHNNSVKEPT